MTRFALNEQAKALLTPHYSFALAQNFRPRARLARQHPQRDAADAAARRPARTRPSSPSASTRLFKAEGKDVPVTLLPGIGHIALTLDPRPCAPRWRR